MSLRQDRVANGIRATLGSLFQGGQLNDPRLEFVLISHVKVSPDLQIATVYFRTFGEVCDIKDVIKGLESAQGLFRKKLAQSIDVRRVPMLRFFYDETVEKAQRLDELFDSL